MALPSVASLALPRPKLPKAVLTRARRLAASPPPEGWLVLYLRPPIPRAIKICVDKKLLRSRSNFAHGICVRF